MEGILWRWARWQGDEAILLNQANSNSAERGKKMDSSEPAPIASVEEGGEKGAKLHVEMKGKFPL